MTHTDISNRLSHKSTVYHYWRFPKRKAEGCHPQQDLYSIFLQRYKKYIRKKFTGHPKGCRTAAALHHGSFMNHSTTILSLPMVSEHQPFSCLTPALLLPYGRDGLSAFTHSKVVCKPWILGLTVQLKCLVHIFYHSQLPQPLPVPLVETCFQSPSQPSGSWNHIRPLRFR